MFERFTQDARDIVVGAKAEAERAGVRYIGTEHLLASMIAIGEGRAYEALSVAGVTLNDVRAETARIVGTAGPLGAEDAAALKTIGIDLDAVMESVERSFGSGAMSPGPRDRQRSGHMPFTKAAKKMLELSLREALRLGHDCIGSEHILLGLIRAGDSTAMQTLVGVGIDVTALRDTLAADLRARPAEHRRRFGIFSPTPLLSATARDAILRAGEEADRMGRRQIGTEHILIALAEGGTGPAYAVLTAAGLRAAGIRRTIATGTSSVTHFTERLTNRGRANLTSRGKAVVASAQKEAMALGAREVGTEHLLLGIIADGQGLAAEILRSAGVSLDELRTSLITELGEAA
jgi:ATP-dependent Clp protease ATP-binding subunit ClpA